MRMSLNPDDALHAQDWEISPRRTLQAAEEVCSTADPATMEGRCQLLLAADRVEFFIGLADEGRRPRYESDVCLLAALLDTLEMNRQQLEQQLELHPVDRDEVVHLDAL